MKNNINKKPIKWLFLLIFWCIWHSSDAQTTNNCTPSTPVFEVKNDGTGYPFNTTDLTLLQTEATRLLQAFPEDYCEKFKVYDYGFSPIIGYTKGGYTAQFDYIKSLHKDEYCLIFARELDENYNLKKIWVDIRLPDDGRFSCLTEMQRSLVNIRVAEAATAVITSGAAFAEMKAMNSLYLQVQKIVECCAKRGARDGEGCNLCPTKEDLKLLLTKEGFISLGEIRTKAKTAAPSNTATINNQAIALDLEAEPMSTFASDIQKELVKRKPSKIYVTDDAFYCLNGGLGDIKKEYETLLDDYDVIIHLSKKDDNDNGEMWVKIQATLFEEEEEDTKVLARGDKDPNLKKYKQKIVFGDMFMVGSWRVPANAHLLSYYETNSRTVIYKHETKPAPNYLFDLLTGLYWGFESSGLLFVPEDELTITTGTEYKICLIKKTYEDGKRCFLVKTVNWSSSTPPKNAQNLEGNWNSSCLKQANNFYTDYDLLSTLKKYNLTQTIIKHVSSNKAITYISNDGINQPKPFDDGKSTIIEINENGDGTVTPKVTMRYPSTKDIIREKGKGKSGTWNPSDAKTAFEASFNDAIKDFAQKQGNTSSEPKIDPSKKRAAETILKTDWGDAGVSEPGIEYKGVDILEMLAAGVKTFNDVVDNAKIPDEMWQNPNAADFPVKDKITYPSGVLNGGMSELKGGVQTFGMIADAVMNPSKTAAALEGFAKGLASWDGATKAAGGFITGIIGLDLDEYNKGGEHQRHATGVVIGTIAAQAVTGSLVLSLADIKNAPNKFGKITDKLKGFSENVRKKYSEALSKLAEKTSKDLGSSACDVTCLLGKIGCLTGNTLVEMKEGEMQTLQTVKEGDLVSSFNHKTQQKESKRISQIQRFWASSIMVLGLSTGNVIEATPNHPFYVRGEYRQAQELHIGDTLFSKNDKIITLNRIFAKDTTVEVFNLVVADNDNFFAGEDAVLTKKCLLERLEDVKYKALSEKIAALDTDLRPRFLEDFGQVEDDILDVLQGLNGIEAWKVLKNTFYSTNKNALEYVRNLYNKTSVGNALDLDYKKTFFEKFPSLEGKIVVHHAIEQQVFDKWPGLFSKAELNSFENLRGISNEINPSVHLSTIRIEWNKFYDQFPFGTTPTRQQVLDYAKQVDDKLGKYFSPPIRDLDY